MPMKIIVGPEAMFVERHGVRTEMRALDQSQATADVRKIALDLWETIRPLVSWLVWVKHRETMAKKRKRAAKWHDAKTYSFLALIDEEIDGVNHMTSVWEPTPKELAMLQAGGSVRLTILGTGHPPVKLSAQPAPEV